jgi:hypothetical protein
MAIEQDFSAGKRQSITLRGPAVGNLLKVHQCAAILDRMRQGSMRTMEGAHRRMPNRVGTRSGDVAGTKEGEPEGSPPVWGNRG